MMREAHIYYESRFAGLLKETVGGFEFVYDAGYLAGGIPISFNFPLQEQPFNSHALPGFFENLVSEGWMRRVQSTQQKIDENDRFGLLLANGRDLVGSISVVPPAHESENVAKGMI